MFDSATDYTSGSEDMSVAVAELKVAINQKIRAIQKKVFVRLIDNFSWRMTLI